MTLPLTKNSHSGGQSGILCSQHGSDHHSNVPNLIAMSSEKSVNVVTESLCVIQCISEKPLPRLLCARYIFIEQQENHGIMR